MYVHLLVCYLNELKNARCKDKDTEQCVASRGDKIEKHKVTEEVNSLH